MGTMLDCGPTTRELIARLTTPSRNRYYYGKLLDAYHLDLEQHYEISKRWMLNRLSLGSGVLCGLHVKASADGKLVRVGSGVAIDGWGREIIVPSNSPAVDPTQPTDGCGQPAGDPVRGGSTVTLYVCYHECEAEPSPAFVSECDERACENGIVREKYRLQIRNGLPNPPGSITDGQCTSIFGSLPSNTTRRIIACGQLNPSCDAPDDACIPIATMRLTDKGTVDTIDECSYRTTVYSNAVLLDLIFCLAARVDICCGGTVTTKSLAIVSGDSQSGKAGQQLPLPLVTRVTDGGANLLGEPVTFTVTVGGGTVGNTIATLSNSFTVNSEASGIATCPMWLLGPAVGTQQVTAQIAVGAPSLVVFHAKVEQTTQTPPVVVAAWPPPGSFLSTTSTDPQMKAWMGIWIKRQMLQLTFDRKMRSADLATLDSWLRLFVINYGDGTITASSHEVVTPAVPRKVYKVPLTYAGPIAQASSILQANGACEEFRLGQARARFFGSKFVLMMRALTNEITSDEATPILLDATFGGTSLSTLQLDELWKVPAGGVDSTFLAGLGPTGPSLPSGDGTAGGQFHSLFAVDKQQ